MQLPLQKVVASQVGGLQNVTALLQINFVLCAQPQPLQVMPPLPALC